MGLACLAALPCAHANGAQKTLEVPPLFAGEGALQNDSFLPGAAEPTQKIAAGDRAFAKARGAQAAEAAAYDEALDLWHAALTASALDDVLVADADGPNTLGPACPDPDRSLARRSESLEGAVVRRLVSLDPKLRGLWRARFEALAAAELDAAGADLERLARIAHDHPLTRSAARAGLQLFDLAFEGGEPVSARAWLARTTRTAAALEPADPALSAALARRSAVLPSSGLESERDPEAPGQSRSAPTAPAPPTWETASRARLLVQVPLRSRGADDPRSRQRRPRPGIAFVGSETVAVQSADVVYLVEGTAGPQSLDLASAAAELALTFAPTFSDPQADLAARPASDGERLVVVAGRALAARGNALVCLARSTATGEWHALWGYGDQAFRAAGSETRPLEEALEPGLWEFEPGPLVEGGRVFVQARQWTGEGGSAAIVDEGRIRAWCFSFDLASGHLVWKRWLAAGAVLEATAAARSVEARGAARPAPPPASHAGRIFADTGLGIGALLDGADGRLLWSVRSQRRASEPARSNSALAPLWSSTAGSNPADPAWLWSPDDSQVIYRMRDGADLDGRGIFARPPRRLEPAEDVLGGDTVEILGWDPTLAPRSLWMQNLESGERWRAVSIEREESRPAQVLLAPARVLFATDRALYFCDRGRELALIDRLPLPGAERGAEPALAGRGERIYAADGSTLWIFGAR